MLQESKNEKKKNYTTNMERKTLNSMNVENTMKKVTEIPT